MPIIISRSTGEIISAGDIPAECKNAAWEMIVQDAVKHVKSVEEKEEEPGN